MAAVEVPDYLRKYREKMQTPEFKDEQERDNLRHKITTQFLALRVKKQLLTDQMLDGSSR